MNMPINNDENNLSKPFGKNSAGDFLQIKRSGKWFHVHTALDQINSGNLGGKQIRFGGGPIQNFSDLIFDLNSEQDCYALGKLVCSREKEILNANDNIYRAQFKVPRFIITSFPLKTIRIQEGDICARANIEFKPCVAVGENGRRAITPVMTNGSLHRMGQLSVDGRYIVAVESLRLSTRETEGTFSLEFQEGIACMQLYQSPPHVSHSKHHDRRMP